MRHDNSKSVGSVQFTVNFLVHVTLSSVGLYTLKARIVESVRGVGLTSWKDLVCLGAIALGIVLFLYGSNYYDAVVGWIGVCFMFGGFLAEIVLRVYGALIKREIDQKP